MKGTTGNFYLCAVQIFKNEVDTGVCPKCTCTCNFILPIQVHYRDMMSKFAINMQFSRLYIIINTQVTLPDFL